MRNNGGSGNGNGHGLRQMPSQSTFNLASQSFLPKVKKVVGGGGGGGATLAGNSSSAKYTVRDLSSKHD